MKLVRPVSMAALLVAASLSAADFWQSKPFTEWTDKEVQKILATSPWVRQAIVSAGASSTGGGTGRRGASAADNPTWMTLPDAGESVAGRPHGGADSDPGRSAALAPVKLTIQWRSALPVKQ